MMTSKTLPTARRATVFAMLASVVILSAIVIHSKAPDAPTSARAATASVAKPVNAANAVNAIADEPMARVTVVGKRLTPAEKAAFDRSGKGQRVASRA